MPTNPVTPQQIAEAFATPLESLIVALGTGISRGQAEMDRNSIAVTQEIAADPVLSQAGLEATWYQIPSAQMEIKMTITLEEQTKAPTTGLTAYKAPRLWASPLNPKVTNQFSYALQAASTVTLTIAAVPPPGAITSAMPAKTVDAISAIANPKLVRGPDGNPKPRVTINFNASARAWFVVQTDESVEPPSLLTLLKIDDETSVILKKTGGV